MQVLVILKLLLGPLTLFCFFSVCPVSCQQQRTENDLSPHQNWLTVERCKDEYKVKRKRRKRKKKCTTERKQGINNSNETTFQPEASIQDDVEKKKRKDTTKDKYKEFWMKDTAKRGVLSFDTKLTLKNPAHLRNKTNKNHKSPCFQCNKMNNGALKV